MAIDLRKLFASLGISIIEIPLLSVTTAPEGTFAVGSKYYDSTEKKIYTSVLADSWEGATESDPLPPSTYYIFDGNYYLWDGNSLEQTDLNLKEDKINKTSSLGQSEQLYMTQKGVTDAVGAKQDILSTASKTVEGKVRFGTGAEIVEGQSEIVTVSAKDLKDRGAEFQQLPFVLQEDVLSSNSTQVASNSQFFFYDNGDVFDADGKTLIKTNPAFIGAVRNMVASEDYLSVQCASPTNVYIYSITKTGENRGTLTLVRTIGGLGGYTASFANDLYILPAQNPSGGASVWYLPVALLNTETALNELTFDPYPQWNVIRYAFNKYIGVTFVETQYTKKLAYATADTLPDLINKTGTYVVYEMSGSNISNIWEADMFIEGTTIIIAGTGGILGVATYGEAGSYADKIGFSVKKIKKFNGLYYFIERATESPFNNYVATLSNLVDALPVMTSAKDVESIGTVGIMTDGTDDILLSEYARVPILQSEVTDLVTADITIANVVANTVYKYGEIDSLTITAVEVSNRKSIIYFSTSADFTTFTPPTLQAFIGSATVEAEKSYKLIIENGIMQLLEFGIPT